jgi:hypothetical protein
MIDPALTTWKAPAVHNLFDSISAKKIPKIRISEDTGIDYIWAPSTSGKFTVSSTYQFIFAVSSNNTISSTFPKFWKAIWKLNLNDRLRLFLWKIAWDILPTKEHLNQIRIPTMDYSCPLCKMAYNSLHHLFFECHFVHIVWRHSFWPLDSTAFQFTTGGEDQSHHLSGKLLWYPINGSTQVSNLCSSSL